MKKVFSLFLAVALTLSLTVSVFAAHITPAISAPEIEAGRAVDVILNINEEVSDIASLQYDVYFDADLFDFTSSAIGTSNDKTVLSTQKTDAAGNAYFSVLYVDNSAGGDPQTFTAGTLYTLTFTAKVDIAEDVQSSFRVLEKALDTSDFTSLRDKDYEGILSVTVKPSAEPAAQVVSASLTLEGDIGVNYYVKLNAALLADKGAYAEFTYKGEPGGKFMLSEMPAEDDGSYRFTQYVAAKEMTEQVTLRLYTGTGGTVPLTNADGAAIEDNAALYSVAQYIENAPAEVKTLGERMAGYGAYAQAYFAFRNIDQDEEHASVLPENMSTKSEKAEDLIAYKPVKTGETEGISSLNLTLTLKSLTTLNIIFKAEEGVLEECDITVDGKAWPAVQAGNWYYVSIPNIAAKDLDELHVVRIGGIEITNCSALSYAYCILQAYQEDDSKAPICNLVRALYEYNAAANEYFK